MEKRITRFRLRREDGFTLAEILIALGIAAGIMGFAASYVGNTPLSQMRQEATRVIRTVNYAYFEAAARAQYWRVTFNLDDQNYMVESSDSPFYVVKEGDEKEAMRLKKEAEEKAKDSLMGGEEGEDGESAAPPEPTGFAESEDELLDVYAVPSGIRLRDVYVMHQKETATTGKAFLYFFPRGQTEFAVIHFAKAEVAEEDPDEDDESGNYMTLIVNPLNGQIEVRNTYVPHEDVLNEMESP